MEFTFKDRLKIRWKMRYFRKMGYKCIASNKINVAYSNTNYMFMLGLGRYDETADILIRFLGESEDFELSYIMFVENNMESVANLTLLDLIDYVIDNYDNLTSLHYCRECLKKYKAYIVLGSEEANRAFREELKQDAMRDILKPASEITEDKKTSSFLQLGYLVVKLNDRETFDFMLSNFVDKSSSLDTISLVLRAKKLLNTAVELADDDLLAKTKEAILPVLENTLNQPIQLSELYFNKPYWEDVASEEAITKIAQELLEKIKCE